MSHEWTAATLGDCIQVSHGFAFAGEFIHDIPIGDVLLTPGNVAIGGGFQGERLKYYDGPVPDGFILEPGALVITMTDLSKESDTLGLAAVLPRRSDGRKYLHNQRIGKVQINDSRRLDPGFLHYLLRSPAYRQEVLASATGTTVKHTSPTRIQRFRFLCPPLREQQAIAHVLGALDEKIAVNQRMSSTLDSLASAIFTSWFIDFDPVQAKAEGRASGLAPSISDLFPKRFHDCERGQIPAGWQVLQLAKLLELAYGRALKAGDRRKGEIPVYGSNGQVGWHDNSLVAGPGIVVGRKGNPGAITWAATDFFVIDTAFYVVPKAPGASLQFLYHALRRQDLGNMGTDSAVPGLNRSLAYMSAQVVPTPAVLSQFDGVANALAIRAHHCQENTSSLAALRDALLPRLISGALRVSDADGIVASAL